jgi:hypothetical protein
VALHFFIIVAYTDGQSQSSECDKEVVLISESGVIFSRCRLVSIVDTDIWGARLSNSMSSLSPLSTCKYRRFQKQKHLHNRFQRTGNEAKSAAAKRFGAQGLLLLMKDNEVDGSTVYSRTSKPAFCGMRIHLGHTQHFVVVCSRKIRWLALI